MATRENVSIPPARSNSPPGADKGTVLEAPEALRSVMSTIPIVMSLFVVNRTGATEFAQEYVSVGLSVLDNENVITYPFQVSTIVVVEENDTLGAVGKDPQVPMHVKIGVYESARALGAPTATNRTVTVMMTHNDFRISSNPQTRTLTHELQCNYDSNTSTFYLLCLQCRRSSQILDHADVFTFPPPAV